MLGRAIIGITLCILGAGIHGAPPAAQADGSDTSWVSRIVSIQGNVRVRSQGEFDWRPANLDEALFAGDQIRVEANSRAGIVLCNDAVLRLDQNTTLVFTEIEQETTFIIKLLRGAANFFSRRPRSLKIVTPFVNGVVEGTEFYVQVDDGQTRIDLFEGRIMARNAFGTVYLAKGQGAVASAGSAPQSWLLVQPRDSVQWALYYPPVPAPGPDDGPAEIRESIALFNQGKILAAIDTLAQIKGAAQDSRFFAYRAGLLVHMGRVSEGRSDIQHALAMDPSNGDALALEAVVAVVQNQRQAALAAAQKAVRSAPGSAAAPIALSYVHQAGFNLAQALQAAQAAVVNAPDNGTAWARLAELRLSTGALAQGIQAAQTAVRLNPHVAHGHTILGFAYLTQIKTEKARHAFNRAIALDSAAPLPRLGLGLAEIRDGDLEQGRSQMEIAVGLDPGNALIRSYLAKAYFDEKRGPLDEQQLEIAKTLDPNDPTPWFYDAIRKQTLNRPVEALQDIQKSMELNDNRGVYRSRLLLDQDLAARSASLGRIYNDLDFQHLALMQGYGSLNADSTNYSAHRLLADTYAAKPRHEIARVSELLQSQLFQPLNLTPVQAHLAESETNVIAGAGPADLSFNEFNPLFTRNRAAFQAGGIRGNNNTWGHEITGSGLLDRISGSIGSFHYETDGFRQNNDDADDLFNLFVQGSLTPDTSLQAEYRYSESESGDLSQNFDGLFSADQRDEEDIIKTRIGAHHRFSSQFEMVASYIHSDVAFERNKTFSGYPGTLKRDIDGDLYEVRTDYRQNRFGLITGFSYMDGAIHQDWRISPFPGVEVPLLDHEKADFFKDNIYAYSNLTFLDKADLVIGLGAASMKAGSQIEKKQLNPKFGLTLQPFSNTRLRLAAFRVLSSTYVSTQTTEPTQVAGFSQFFDDLDASDVRSYGMAIDQKFSKRLFGGIEYLRRDLDAPEFNIGSEVEAEYSKWKEYTGIAYLYWAPSDAIALRAEYQYEQFDRRDNPMTFDIVDIETHRVPLSLRFFSPLGFSFRVATTYFYQQGEFAATDTREIYSDSDSFWIIDTEVAFRLPKQWGILSFGVKNLLDEQFNYTDTDPSNPAVVPGVFAFGKITLSY